MVDTPQTLAAALAASSAKAVAETRAIVQKGAQNIKTEAKANVLRSAPIHHANAANFITYDTGVLRNGTTVDAEIGYDKEKGASAGKKGPGAIGNLLEFGGGKDHSPPHRDLARALEAEEPRFEQAISTMASRLL